MLSVEQLGQRQVVAGLDLRAGAHRVQKHVSPGSKQFTATRKAPSRRAA